MVRALVFAGGAPWQTFLGSVDLQQAENEWELHSSWHGELRGTAEGRSRHRVEFVKQIRMCHPRRLKVRTGSRSLEFEVVGSWRNGDLMVGYRRKFRERSGVEQLVVLCLGGEADDLEKTRDMATERDAKIESISPAEELGQKGISDAFLDVKQKIQVLNDLELQPSVSRRGWLVQLKMAVGGLFEFLPMLPMLPMLPVQEEYMEVPTEPTGPSIVWDGWGTSLCWWANFVGGLPEVDKDYVIDLIFDQRKGLGFNIARYNIGGGADLTFDTNIRPFADIPGFKTHADGDYDWSADARQREVLLGAKARGANLFEAFSNSPPRWMTHTGSVTGSWWGGQDNLKPKHYATFADYLTEVVQQYEKLWDIHFNYLAPFNEPVEGFWNLDRSKPAQEGCNFSVPSIDKLIKEVHKSLSSKGLSTQITAADSWSLNTPKILRGLGQEALDAVSQINVHTYIPIVQREGDAKRSEVKGIVGGLGKRLWMSEYGPLNLGGSELDIALAVGRHITLDINELQASAWCYWQVVEIPGRNFYWGLLHAEFKYDLDRIDPFRVQIKKQYYIMMHFSRWIQPGFTIFVSEGRFRDWLVMAVDPSTKATAVLVFTNTSNRNIDINFDVSGIAPGLRDYAVEAALVRTSDTENHKELASINYKSPVITVRIVSRCITTIIVSKAGAVVEG